MSSRTEWSQGQRCASYHWSIDWIQAALQCTGNQYSRVQDVLKVGMHRKNLIEILLRVRAHERLERLFNEALQSPPNRSSLKPPVQLRTTHTALTRIAQRINATARRHAQADSYGQRSTMRSSQAGANPETGTALSTPAAHSTSALSSSTSPTATPDTIPSDQSKLGDELIIAVYGDGKISAHFLREVVSGGKSQALLDPEHVSLDQWKAMMREHGFIGTSAGSEVVAISWAMGDRKIQDSSDRAFRVGITYMTTHQDTIVFDVEGGQAGQLPSRCFQ